MYTRILLFFFLSVPVISSAEEKGYMGFSIDVSVSGFFNPKLKEVLIKEVAQNSPAERSGLKPKQSVLEINGCKIPGCETDQAKFLMSKQRGETLVLLVKKLDGETVKIKIVAE